MLETLSSADTFVERNDRVLSVENLTVVAKGAAMSRPVVSELCFNLARGETLALAGESGSGKSLTALAIMGLLPKPAIHRESGAIWFDGTDIAQHKDRMMRHIRGKRIAMIFQEPMTSLNPILKIGRQLTEAIITHTSANYGAAKRRAIEALEAVDISDPERRLGQHPLELSGGMRQRVMIAMALALEPDILIADEPTTALDVTTQKQILQILNKLQRDHGTAIIFITHDMGVVAEIADRVLILREGRLLENSDVYEIFDCPKHPYTQQLLAAVPRFKCEGQTTDIAIEPDESASPLLVAKDFTVRFRVKGGFLKKLRQQVHAVESVSFNVGKNETFALVGESGSGKSTTAKAMAGLVEYDGDIIFNGQNLKHLGSKARRAVRRDIQMIFQDSFAALDPRMTVEELVREPLDIHNVDQPSARRDRVADLFVRVGLRTDQLARYPHEFSGGQRQRVCIARALALNPKLILADECVSALDVSVQADILDLLQEIKNEFGVSLLFISHDIAVVENIADRVAVMYLGQIVEMGTPAQVFFDPQHSYTQKLISSIPSRHPSRRSNDKLETLGGTPTSIRTLGDIPSRLKLTDVGAGHLVAEEMLA